MLYRLKLDSYISKVDEKSVIANSTLKKESVVDQSGGVFLSALGHVPQTLETLVQKLLQTFVGVDAAAITPDAKEFYDGFVRDGYLVSGETYADLNAAEYGEGYDKQAALKVCEPVVGEPCRTIEPTDRKAYFHLPGLFENYNFYKKFLPIFFNYREFFYDWAAINSLYGAPAYCVWNSGRILSKASRANVRFVLNFVKEYDISAKFTFSNALLEEKHLQDTYCNNLLEMFHNEKNGIIVNSDLLKNYIAKNFPKYYFVSSTTKCITEKEKLFAELEDESYRYVVPDYNFVNDFEVLNQIPMEKRSKIELMSNTVCVPNCPARSKHYEFMDKCTLGLKNKSFSCASKSEGKKFSFSKKGMRFITIDKIQSYYLPNSFCNFKLEGRNYGELRLLEEILYYMVKPEYQLEVREMMYLSPWADFPKESA